jgi:uncharacterized protein
VNFGDHFEWDDEKEISNLVKHGVSFVEAAAAFADPRRVILPDISHSHSKPRWYCVGRVGDAILTVRFTRRREYVRIIGAGYWRKGKRIYETQNRIR